MCVCVFVITWLRTNQLSRLSVSLLLSFFLSVSRVSSGSCVFVFDDY